MPKRMVNLLAQMDETGVTEVILGQGRTTTDTLEEEGRYKSGRGVRQGSIGGPIKWVVYSTSGWNTYTRSTRERDTR